MKTLLQLYISQSKIFFRDFSTVVITLALPVILAVFFALIFSPNDYSLRMTIVDFDNSSMTQQITDSIANDTEGKILVNIQDEAEARTALAKAETDVVVIFYSGAGSAFQLNQESKASILYDPSRSQSAGVGLQVAKSLFSELNMRAAHVKPLLIAEEKTVLSEHRTLAEFYLPNFLALSVLWISLFATTLPLVKDRESAILLRMGATPLSPLTLVSGFALWRLTVGLIQTIIFLAAGMIILGLPVPPNPLLLILAILVGNLVFVIMGFMISALSSSVESANAITQIVNFPMMFLSGIFFTSDMLPEVVNKISYIIPLTYLADMYRQILVGYPGIFPLWVCFIVLILFGVICLFVSLRKWRWK